MIRALGLKAGSVGASWLSNLISMGNGFVAGIGWLGSFYGTPGLILIAFFLSFLYGA